MSKTTKRSSSRRPPRPRTGPDLPGLGYLDIRRTAGGIQLSMGPNEQGQPFITRLRYSTATELAEALETGRKWVHVLGDGRYGIGYEPKMFAEDVAGFAVVDLGESDDEPTILVRWSAPEEQWRAGVAGNVRQVLEYEPLPDDGADPWAPEPYHLCAGCFRPVYDSEPSALMVGARRFGMHCSGCAERELERAEREEL